KRGVEQDTAAELDYSSHQISKNSAMNSHRDHRERVKSPTLLSVPCGVLRWLNEIAHLSNNPITFVESERDVGVLQRLARGALEQVVQRGDDDSLPCRFIDRAADVAERRVGDEFDLRHLGAVKDPHELCAFKRAPPCAQNVLSPGAIFQPHVDGRE